MWRERFKVACHIVRHPGERRDPVWWCAILNPDFPLELVARVSKMLKMCAKKGKFCGGVAHSTLTHKFSFFRAQIQLIDRSQ